MPKQGLGKRTAESTNGLIRRFFPKGTNFDTIKHKEIKQAAKWINNRPMKVSGYKTPNEMYQELKKVS